jgi:hypothetical protein
MSAAETLDFLRQLLFATPASAVVNLTIILLFVSGLVDVAAAMRRLRQERNGLRQARTKLSAAVTRAAEGATAVLGVLGVSRTSLLGRRVERVLQARGAGLRHPGMLRELTGDRLAGYGALARYIGAILTLLGLLGTVLGLSFALFNIHQALGKANDVAAFSELTRALGQTLLGMRTAFACTLAGLSTALFLSLGNHLVSRFQARVAADLEEFVACELLVALERVDPGADEAARVFARLLVEAGQSLGGLREEVTAAAVQYVAASQQMAASVQALGASVEAFGHHVAGISEGQRAVAEATRDSGEALRSMRVLFADWAERQQEALGSQLHASQEAYESSLNRHMQELQALVGQNREIVTDLTAAQGAALTAVSDMALDVRAHLVAVGPADPAKTLTATLEASQDALKDLRGLAARFEPAVTESQQQLRAATEAALAEVRTAVTQVLTEITQQTQAGIAEQAHSLEKALAAAIDRHAASQDSTMKAFLDLVIDLRGLPLAGNGRGSHPVGQVRP